METEEDRAQERQSKTYFSNPSIPANSIILPNEAVPEPKPSFHKKVIPTYMNMDFIINSKYYPQLEKMPAAYKARRSGALGYKVGMTALWDKWGTRHALTVIQLDRCQVIQIKTKENDGYTGLQLGNTRLI